MDVGGESARPGATPVTPEEEWNRIGDVVAALVEAGICVSVDTRHAEVATRALHAGASIVNDVSGFRDPAMVEAVRRCGCGCVVMHMKGEPATMQNDPVYEDVVAEVRDYLRMRNFLRRHENEFEFARSVFGDLVEERARRVSLRIPETEA